MAAPVPQSPPPEGYVLVGEADDHTFKPKEGPDHSQRLSLEPAGRIPAFLTFGFVFGGILGLANEYRRASLRFRAENAHRLPRSEKNWFFYHRAKSNYALAAAMPTGAKWGLRTSGMTLLFLLIEQGLDAARGGTSKDFLSSTAAGFAFGGVYSLWRRFDLRMSRRYMSLGAKGGLIMGLAQDLHGYAMGRHLFYVDYIKKIFGIAESSDTTDMTA
ncbi:hypothetical protein BT63DRAFT_251343 [Microthyrium microscopicum]|uniref:Tim17-domain-containing protein n=1 Tax=Microthyrium microscopicum TaxID=703497 RepID=A0A6A6UB21_9PEZI|nr:hypothetical protein BT63DRAFT_251343 [Microthyrium microscopicum]